MSNGFENRLSVNLEKISKAVNVAIPMNFVVFLVLGLKVSFYFHFLTVAFFLLAVLNFYYMRIQTHHTLLSNFGLLAQLRYLMESVGPEFRQYLYSSDTEERPFTRVERSEVYQRAKGVDSTSAFGSQLNFGSSEYKLRHSMFPVDNKDIKEFSLMLGSERGIENVYRMRSPIMISAMSYGALGQNAVRSLARGAKKAGILINTGEGGWPKHHLLENCDLIFQMGTAKFGVRNEDGSLNDDKLRKLSQLPQIKIIEIKFSQGAKPGKGGLLPKEKITKEISELRGVPMGQDVLSPPYHLEARDVSSTVDFIKRVQDVSQLPVGIKLCLGRESEFIALMEGMKTKNIFPDYISIDGAEGGTGAAPKSFMDDVGLPLFEALPRVNQLLMQYEIRNKLKLFCAGKLISSGRQFMALSMGADAIYTARGFMLALGCIQALQCNKNTCPVGITTHLKHLQRGVDVEEKSERIYSYVKSLEYEYQEMLASMGKTSFDELSEKNLYYVGRF